MDIDFKGNLPHSWSVNENKALHPGISRLSKHKIYIFMYAPGHAGTNVSILTWKDVGPRQVEFWSSMLMYLHV